MPHPVIVGVDDPASSAAAVDWGADEARLRGLRLHLVRARNGKPGVPGSPAEQEVHRSEEQEVRECRERAVERHPGLEVTGDVLDAPAREALVALSREAALLVLGTRGSGGFPELLVGSTSLHVAAHAAGPVVVVPGAWSGPEPGGGGTGAGIAVGLGGREPAESLLTFAFEQAQRRELPLLTVHAWSYPLIVGPGHAFPAVYEEGHVADEQARLLAEVLAGWRERFPDVEVVEDSVHSGPAKRLVELSASQRLVVVGRHGHPGGPVARLGSVSQAVVLHAHCPVAVLPVD